VKPLGFSAGPAGRSMTAQGRSADRRTSRRTRLSSPWPEERLGSASSRG
jgi:hypothetical protein